MTTTQTTAFAIRTDDAAWIARNHGTADASGRIIVMVPAAEVEKVTFCGKAQFLAMARAR